MGRSRVDGYRGSSQLMTLDDEIEYTNELYQV